MTVERVETPSASHVLRRRSGPARHIIAAASWLTMISLLLQPVAAFAAPTTGFNHANTGPYDYNDTANWVGGVINGIWDSGLNLTVNQTVTFGADTATTGWTFNYNPYDADENPYCLTLKCGLADRTVTLGGNISIDPRGLYRPAVYIGSQTSGEKLTIALDTANRTFTGSGNLYFENAITSGSGAYGITIKGAGLGVDFRGANTYSGPTTVNGSSLNLDYGYSNTSKLSDTAALILSGGNVTLYASQGSGANHAQVVGSTTINAGASRVTFYDADTLTLSMKTIARNPGGTLLVSHESRASTDNTNANGILGGWAVVMNTSTSQGDWAVNSANGDDGLIRKYSGYTALTGAGADSNNSRIPTSTSVTLTGDRVTNSLKIESGVAGKSLALETKKLTLTSGGLLQTSGQNGWNAGFTISGAEGVTGITAGAGNSYELIVHSYTSDGLTISAVIGDNIVEGVTHSVSLTKSGGGKLVLANGRTQTYTGQTCMNEGYVQVDGTLSAGGGAVNVNGGTLCGSGTINRPVVVNDGAKIQSGHYSGAGAGTLTLGNDLTVPLSAVVSHGPSATPTIRIGGMVTINGTITAPNFEMRSGSTLKGIGTLAQYFNGSTYTRGQVTLKSGATLRPGGSIGKLTASGVDISHEAGSIFAWEAIGYVGESGIGDAGTAYSQVAMDSGGKFTLARGTLGKLYFPAGVDFSGSFWNSNRIWDIITGGSSSTSGSIANDDIKVYVNNSEYDGGDRTITGQGAFSIAYVNDGILRLTWTAASATAGR